MSELCQYPRVLFLDVLGVAYPLLGNQLPNNAPTNPFNTKAFISVDVQYTVKLDVQRCRAYTYLRMRRVRVTTT